MGPVAWTYSLSSHAPYQQKPQWEREFVEVLLGIKWSSVIVSSRSLWLSGWELYDGLFSRVIMQADHSTLRLVAWIQINFEFMQTIAGTKFYSHSKLFAQCIRESSPGTRSYDIDTSNFPSWWNLAVHCLTLIINTLQYCGLSWKDALSKGVMRLLYKLNYGYGRSPDNNVSVCYEKIKSQIFSGRSTSKRLRRKWKKGVPKHSSATLSSLTIVDFQEFKLLVTGLIMKLLQSNYY